MVVPVCLWCRFGDALLHTATWKSKRASCNWALRAVGRAGQAGLVSPFAVTHVVSQCVSQEQVVPFSAPASWLPSVRRRG